MKIRGRGKLRVTLKADGDGAILRVDDDSRPDFWAVIYLSASDLEAVRTAEILPDAPVVVIVEATSK